MKKILLIAFIFLFIKVEAQNMVISFSSTKSDEKIDSVLVENLSQGKSVVLKGTTNLELTASPITSAPIYGVSSPFKIYPNPVSDVCLLQFENNKSGNVVVGLYDLTGKQILSQTRFLEQGVHEFQLSGLPSGISVIKIVGASFNYTDKIISTGKGTIGLNLKYSGESSNEQNPTQLKSATTNVLMQYDAGERLKYTLYSNGNSTVQTDVPTQSKTIASTFYEAKDADGNSYATVQIGTQIWMAENLKTTKYRNGDPISKVVGDAIWRNTRTGLYCNYKDDEGYGKKYGKLYNWSAVTDSRRITPKGWHVASDAEWTTLTNYLIANRITYGYEAKALAAGLDWITNLDVGTIGADLSKNNSSGFTALPGGNRGNGGAFERIGYSGSWWSSTKNFTYFPWFRKLYSNFSDVTRNYQGDDYGLSVRCVKD